MDLKQVIVIRKDLEMSRGKAISQACHASLGSYKKAKYSIRKKWEEDGAKKVVLEIDNEEELMNLKNMCDNMGIPNYLVKDKGKTEVKPGTITALGIGPDSEEKINRVTGNLKLLR